MRLYRVFTRYSTKDFKQKEALEYIEAKTGWQASTIVESQIKMLPECLRIEYTSCDSYNPRMQIRSLECFMLALRECESAGIKDVEKAKKLYLTFGHYLGLNEMDWDIIYAMKGEDVVKAVTGL